MQLGNSASIVASDTLQKTETARTAMQPVTMHITHDRLKGLGRSALVALTAVLMTTPATAWAQQRVVQLREGAATGLQVPLYQLGSGWSRVLSTVEASVAGREIAIDTVSFEALPDRLELELLDGSRLIARRSYAERRGPGRALWRGWADGQRVVLTLHSGLVAGRIETPDGVHQILPLPGGGHGLAKLDSSLFGPCLTEAELTIANPSEPSPSRGTVAPTDATAPADAVDPTDGGDPEDSIDVMAMYTPQARDAAGGVAAIEATIQSAVDVTNAAFAASDMVARFNLVHTALANHNDTGSLSADKTWLSNDPTVASLRNLHSADMVSLINQDGGGFCGLASVMRNPGPSFASSAFQVTARACAVGNLSWAHEHGHNMGFEHDPANGPTPSQASYDWSFGHPVNGSYRTVMSYSNQCSSGCTRVGQFSNPDVNYLGTPTGIANQRDNHRSGNLTASIVANFRLAPDPAPNDLVGIYRSADRLFLTDVDGSGTWTPPTDKACQLGVAGDVPLVGDWNGDGVDEPGVYRPSTRQFLLDVNGDCALNFGAGGDLGCRFIGLDGEPIIGDWNGDGDDDIGLYDNRLFRMDLDESCSWTPATDAVALFGLSGDTPIIGDWNADGDDDIGIYRPSNRIYLMDRDESGTWTPPGDLGCLFGLSGDTPIIGDWNSDGDDQIGAYRPSARMFLMDRDESCQWSLANDLWAIFGQPGDQPIIGSW